MCLARPAGQRDPWVAGRAVIRLRTALHACSLSQERGGRELRGRDPRGGREALWAARSARCRPSGPGRLNRKRLKRKRRKRERCVNTRAHTHLHTRARALPCLCFHNYPCLMATTQRIRRWRLQREEEERLRKAKEAAAEQEAREVRDQSCPKSSLARAVSVRARSSLLLGRGGCFLCS